ncbi:MAG: PQQ-dependent sugar dehydrogenase [Flavobacteriales bacterium]|nr:PQQ-dependent sugar dehydrogenase [Flavobacteriales bacterium]
MDPFPRLGRAILATFVFAATVAVYQVSFAQVLPPDFSVGTTASPYFQQPTGIVWDANGRQYVWEKGGKVWIISGGVRLPNPLIDLSAEVGNWRDHGLLGFALDPDFLSNGRIYLMYTVDRHHLKNFGTVNYSATSNEYYAATIIRITRYTAIGPTFNTVDPNSRYILLGESAQTGVPVLHESHGPGTLVFANDGTLMATVGDGASYNHTDTGNAPDTYDAVALADGIIREAEDVGAFRSQMLNSHNGKLLRMDPETGNGIPSNPYYDASAPRSAKSRVWALGLRNPYRMTKKPNSGSTDPTDGNPGVFFIGDVGWQTWEDLNLCVEGGMNFGWPLFEGLDPSPTYINAFVENRDVPNPLYNGTSCTQEYLRFQDLLKQDTRQLLNTHPNPCNAGVPIPSSIPKWLHSRPSVDWNHGFQSRVGGYSGNDAVTFDLDAGNSPVPGPRFGGFAAIGGPVMAGQNLPVGYQNCSYHADYAGGWIKRFKYNEADELVSVHDFASELGLINWLGEGPDGCLWYIRYEANEVRRICFNGSVDFPPVAVATQSVQFGPGPLTVNFNGSGSYDPEGLALTHEWDFGDGGTSALANPSHTFTSPPGVVTTYTVTLTVTDDIGQTATQELIVSVNNSPPSVNITSIPVDALFPVGVDTTYALQASVVDAEHSAAQLTYAWRTTLYHNTHNHPEPIDANVSSSTVISGVGCDGDLFFYTVSLAVTDAGGLTGYSERTLFPRCNAIAPIAVISTSVSAGIGPLLVAFDGTGSYDPGTIESYSWDFGDGTSSSSATPSKTFSAPGDHQITLTVTDDDGLVGQTTHVITVLTLDPPQCVGPSGSVLREYWSDLSGFTINDLLNSPDYPDAPTGTSFMTSMSTPNDFGNNYGQRIRGYIIAPSTGGYTFGVTSDDHSAVYVSLNADPQYKQLVCSVSGYTGYSQLDKYPSQVSPTIQLQAGRYYYVEMLHKEGGGGDFAAMWWKTPTNGTFNLVPGSALARWEDCGPSVQLRMALQGPWDAAANRMKDDLRSAGLLPLLEPYAALGFNLVGSGGETIPPATLAVTGNNAVVDWVLVELRNRNNPSQVVATKSALLQRDGDVVGKDGYSRLVFDVPEDDYYIAVRHRNHLGVMTFATRPMGANVTAVDFTQPNEATHGTDARIALPNGKRALWAGNTVQDGFIRYTGLANDRDPILEGIGGVVPTNTVQGYSTRDVNLDGVIRYTGPNNDRDIILFNIGGSVATNVRLQQLP